MNLTIPADFPVERVQKALASEGLAIRAEIKHGETRHVLTESPAPGPMGDARKPCGNGTSREANSFHGEIAPAGADRLAHETGVHPYIVSGHPLQVRHQCICGALVWPGEHNCHYYNDDRY